MQETRAIFLRKRNNWSWQRAALKTFSIIWRAGRWIYVTLKTEARQMDGSFLMIISRTWRSSLWGGKLQQLDPCMLCRANSGRATQCLEGGRESCQLPQKGASVKWPLGQNDPKFLPTLKHLRKWILKAYQVRCYAYHLVPKNSEKPKQNSVEKRFLYFQAADFIFLNWSKTPTFLWKDKSMLLSKITMCT